MIASDLRARLREHETRQWASFDGRIALIAGSSRGIGRGIALELAREGANIVVNYRRDAAAAQATVAAIEDWAEGDRGAGRRGRMAAGAGPGRTGPRGTFGHLDIVVANSGVASRVPVWDMDIDHWHKVIGVNLHGVFYTCKATAKHLVDRSGATIILVSSIGADACGPIGAPYYVAKAAVNALTKSLAKECAPAGVRVNCIAPG